MFYLRVLLSWRNMKAIDEDFVSNWKTKKMKLDTRERKNEIENVTLVFLFFRGNGKIKHLPYLYKQWTTSKLKRRLGLGGGRIEDLKGTAKKATKNIDHGYSKRIEKKDNKRETVRGRLMRNPGTIFGFLRRSKDTPRRHQRSGS